MSDCFAAKSPRNDMKKLAGDAIINVPDEYKRWTLPSPRRYNGSGILSGKDLIRESREQSGEGPGKWSFYRHR
jgi:hypothetical protein